MKIVLGFKTPDAVEYGISEAVLAEARKTAGEQTEEVRDRLEDLSRIAHDAVKKFVLHGEYIRVEIDTETGLATVLPAR